MGIVSQIYGFIGSGRPRPIDGRWSGPDRGSAVKLSKAQKKERRLLQERIDAKWGTKGKGKPLTVELVAIEPDVAESVTVVAPKPVLLVPLPDTREMVEGMSAASRDGQADFRAMVIEAYGKCCVTGCEDVAALQAAHIVPYVSSASNIIQNGLCLRSDVHALYDAHLIEISHAGIVKVSASIRSEEYRAMDGMAISGPRSMSDRPNAALLVEHRRW